MVFIGDKSSSYVVFKHFIVSLFNVLFKFSNYFLFGNLQSGGYRGLLRMQDDFWSAKDPLLSRAQQDHIRAHCATIHFRIHLSISECNTVCL